MSTPDPISPEQLLLEKLLAERAELDQQIAFLEKRLGRVATADSGARPASEALPISKGDFFGMSRAEAAITLLRRLRRTLSTNEIFNALADSGLDMSGKNTMSALYTALARRPETKKVAKNTWGLKEWYPHLKEVKKKNSETDITQHDSQSPPPTRPTIEKEE